MKYCGAAVLLLIVTYILTQKTKNCNDIFLYGAAEYPNSHKSDNIWVMHN